MNKKDKNQENKPKKSPVETEQGQKKESLLKRKAAFLWLTTTFPGVFDIQKPKPLKRQIEKDIFPLLGKDTPTRTCIRRLIAYLTSLRTYHEAVLKEKKRVDLEGKGVEAITTQEKEYSKERIAAILEKKHRGSLSK